MVGSPNAANPNPRRERKLRRNMFEIMNYKLWIMNEISD